MKQTYITLNNGTKIPQFGMGVFMVPAGDETKNACLEALKLGYRHIDTAHAYQNERSVGEAVRESGIPREEIWVTSKLWPSEYGEGKTMEGIDKMLVRLDIGYIDLLLLHQQVGDYMGAWKDMEKAVAQGKVRTIGLSNFESDRLEEVIAAAEIKPAVLQVELHPYFQQNALKERVGIKKTIRDYVPDEEDFLARLDDMVEQAFDDQCTGANPRYPLMSEIKQMYLNAYYGEHSEI